MTTLSQQLADYLAVRRSLGFDMTFEERVLRVFTAFADREAVDHITVDLFLRWKAAFGTANNDTWAHRLGMVRGFARWLKGYDERTEVPPAGLIPAKWQRPRPYIYSDKQVAAVVARAAKLRSHYGLRGWTFSTLFGLIAVTGLRINEALKLDDGDVDLDAGVITVKRGKKARPASCRSRQALSTVLRPTAPNAFDFSGSERGRSYATTMAGGRPTAAHATTSRSSPRTWDCARHSASASTGVDRASTMCVTRSPSAPSWAGTARGSTRIGRCSGSAPISAM